MKKSFVLCNLSFVLIFALISCGKTETIPTASATVITKTASQETTVSEDISQPSETEISEDAGTGGDVALAYEWKMAMPHGSFIPAEIRSQYITWSDFVWKNNPINKAIGSFYDYIREFDISEEYFRETNKGLLEPYSDEEINDLYHLNKEEFNKKYASPYFIAKGEALYNTFELLELAEDELLSLDITAEDLNAQLDIYAISDPEMVDFLRDKYADKLK